MPKYPMYALNLDQYLFVTLFVHFDMEVILKVHVKCNKKFQL